MQTPDPATFIHYTSVQSGSGPSQVWTGATSCLQAVPSETVLHYEHAAVTLKEQSEKGASMGKSKQPE